MNEPTDPIDLYDLGEKALKPGQSVWLNYDRFDMPAGDYRLYAERIIDASLAERMSDHWGEWWKWNVRSDQDMHFRMQTLIDEFGLVERSKLPSPPEVPDDVRKAATFVSSNGWGVGSVENVDTLVQWVLEQAGETNG